MRVLRNRKQETENISGKAFISSLKCNSARVCQRNAVGEKSWGKMLKAKTSLADEVARRSLGLKSEQGLGRIRDETGETEQCRALRTTKMGRDGVVEDLPFQSLPLMPYSNPTPMPMFGCCPRV